MMNKPFQLSLKYLAMIGVIFGVAACAWIYLSNVMIDRTYTYDQTLRSKVGELWGGAHNQKAPTLVLDPQPKSPSLNSTRPMESAETGNAADQARAASHRAVAGQKSSEGQGTLDTATPPSGSSNGLSEEVELTQRPQMTDAKAQLNLEHRKKGLLWYNTFTIKFASTFRFHNPVNRAVRATFFLPLPAKGAVYDAFTLLMNGKTLPFRFSEINGDVVSRVILQPDADVAFQVNYISRGLGDWIYQWGERTGAAKNFSLVLQTNFEKIDFPEGAISPTSQKSTNHGWELKWAFKDLIADSKIHLMLPQKINPGPLAAEISRFGPLSLGFFFFVLLIVSLIKQIRLHPMHFLLLAAAFFSFHLLLAYLVDHLPLGLSFIIASLTSVGLVVSYLRLVVGARFAWLWAGGAQLCYLILFSLAFFLEGYTGLTITIFSVLTLFIFMQLTAKVDWNQLFNPEPPEKSTFNEAAFEALAQMDNPSILKKENTTSPMCAAGNEQAVFTQLK